MSNKPVVAVVFGGRSSEYGVSLVSSASVLENMPDKYDVIMVGITKEGNAYLVDATPEQIREDHWLEQDCRPCTFSMSPRHHGLIELSYDNIIPVDVVFPVMHGINGEDGRLQGMLELADIPYVGCDMMSSAICMNKQLAKKLVKDEGIRVAEGKVFKENDYEAVRQSIEPFGYPVFVKPMRAGSSFGVTKVESEDQLKKAIDEAFKYDTEILVEEFIDGFEVGCAVLGSGNDLIVGEVDEIELTNGFFDFYEKYNIDTSTIHLPARLSEEERNRIKEVSKKIYGTLGCGGFARVDSFYTPKGEIVFNEVNTIPGFTSHSRYPSMMKEAGYSFSRVLEMLIDAKFNKNIRES